MCASAGSGSGVCIQRIEFFRHRLSHAAHFMNEHFRRLFPLSHSRAMRLDCVCAAFGCSTQSNYEGGGWAVTADENRTFFAIFAALGIVTRRRRIF